MSKPPPILPAFKVCLLLQYIQHACMRAFKEQECEETIYFFGVCVCVCVSPVRWEMRVKEVLRWMFSGENDKKF